MLGGDGTILRAAELTRGTSVPLLGVNLGHVGFLAESEREDIGEAVRRLTAGEFDVEERGTLDVRVLRPDGSTGTGWALNEAALEKVDRSRMLEVLLEVDGHPLSSFGCDGDRRGDRHGLDRARVLRRRPGGLAGRRRHDPGPDLRARAVRAAARRRPPQQARGRGARPVAGRGPGDARRAPTARGARRVRGSRSRRSDIPVRLARLTPAPFTTRLVNKFGLPVDGWRGRPSAPRPSARPSAAPEVTA